MSSHSTDALPGLSKGRVEGLTDGIFATVMTVLVLTLSVPVVTGPLTSSELNFDVFVALEGLAPDILGYLLSFLLLAVMWVSHHNVFHFISRMNRPLLWLNILFLLMVGFVPFSTALLGRYPLIQLPVVIYGANIVAISLSMHAFLSYAVREKMLVAQGEDGALIGRIIKRWRLGTLIYSVAIAFSFVDTRISVAIYVVALAYYVVYSSLGFTNLSAKSR